MWPRGLIDGKLLIYTTIKKTKQNQISALLIDRLFAFFTISNNAVKNSTTHVFAYVCQLNSKRGIYG